LPRNRTILRGFLTVFHCPRRTVKQFPHFDYMQVLDSPLLSLLTQK